jgi:hypothetical protein
MFQAIGHSIQKAADAMIARYMSRLIVVVPFLIALAFLLAAAVIQLSMLYGSVVAYGSMAIFFFVVGICASAAISGPEAVTEADPIGTEQAGQQTEKPLLTADAVMAAIASVAPSIGPTVVRAGVRNWALVLLVALVTVLLYRDVEQTKEA